MVVPPLRDGTLASISENVPVKPRSRPVFAALRRDTFVVDEDYLTAAVTQHVAAVRTASPHSLRAAARACAIRSFITWSSSPAQSAVPNASCSSRYSVVQLGVDRLVLRDRRVDVVARTPHTAAWASATSAKPPASLPAATAPKMAAPEGAGLVAARDLHGPAGDVGVDLHQQRVLHGQPAAVDDLAAPARRTPRCA